MNVGTLTGKSKELADIKFDEARKNIPRGERVVIGTDLDRHVRARKIGDEEVMGRNRLQNSNMERKMVVDFEKRINMAMVNTFFQKW